MSDGCKCGAGPHPLQTERCASGHPLPGFPGPALVHGGRSREIFRGEDAQSAMQAKRAAIETDLGADLSTIHRDQICAYVQTQTLRQSMFDLFVRTGAKGRSYERFLSVL